MSAFAGRFVPVKIVTDGNPQWSQWARKYPIDGNGIPRLYVIRADGEMLYGAVGSLPGDQLPKMLIAALDRSGRVFSEPEAQSLSTAVKESKASLEAGDYLRAAIMLSSLNGLGSPENLGSFAGSAMVAGEIYKNLQTLTDEKVAEAQSRLSESQVEEPFEAALTLSQAEAACKLFPKLRHKVSSVGREHRKNKDFAEAFAQADALVRARSLRSAPNARVRSRASKAFLDVIVRFPDSPADRLARAEREEIDPGASIPNDITKPSVDSRPESFRKWTARSGQFSTTAQFVRQAGEKVQLRKKDGKVIWVEISILSNDDQTWLEKKSSESPSS